jgi:hypothetical protein
MDFAWLHAPAVGQMSHGYLVQRQERSAYH